MVSASPSASEAERLAALHRYHILDTPPERAFDDLTRIASLLCGVPISLISFVDDKRLWIKSRIGWEATQGARETAFCTHTIQEPGGILVVSDVLSDSRFADNPLVVGDPAIRFYAGAPIVTPDGFALGALCVLDRIPRHLQPAQQHALAALARQAAALLELRRHVVDLEALAATDALTGLSNCRTLQERLNTAFERAQRGSWTFSVLLVDVDHFKSFNDSFGHPAGDGALRKVADLLRSQARRDDLVARYGGEEFAVLLPGADAPTAARIAERLRMAVERNPWIQRSLTISVGAATFAPSLPNAAALIVRADEALYEAKRCGRNRTIHADHLGRHAPIEAVESAMVAMFDTAVEGWARILDVRDREPEGHCLRVAALSVRLARRLGCSERALTAIRWGALLHDVGKVSIPDRILLKPGPLSDEEWEVIRHHTTLAREMLAPIPFLNTALEIPYCHHERWDGSGYPQGLRGTEIPFAARVFAVVDVWDALRSERPHRPGRSEAEARAYIAEQAGVQFDPTIAAAFLEMLAEDEAPEETTSEGGERAADSPLIAA